MNSTTRLTISKSSNEAVAKRLRDRGLYPTDEARRHPKTSTFSVQSSQDNGPMGRSASDTKIQVLRGAPWKDVIIKLLEPDSPYRPWSSAADVSLGMRSSRFWTPTRPR